MWTRVDLKTKAKDILSRCHWTSVLVCFIITVLGAAGGGGSIGSGYNYRERDTVYDEDQHINEYKEIFDTDEHYLDYGDEKDRETIAEPWIVGTMIGIFVLVFFLAFIFVFVFYCFVANILFVGSKRYFVISRERKSYVGELVYLFKRDRGYWNTVVTMLKKGVFNFLWYLLLVVPGIIKSYEYRMIPYILAENSKLDSRRVFAISKEMMDGQKWNTFVLDLSFIGWNILNAMTCGILGVLYVNPYMAHTEAELYSVLRGNLINSGKSNTYELLGYGEETTMYGRKAEAVNTMSVVDTTAEVIDYGSNEGNN